jgi:hypothetical protein
MFLNFHYVPKELFILCGIYNAGLTSYLYCYFCFWYGKKRPFFYVHMKKIKILLLVENRSLSSAANRLLGPLCWGILAAAGNYVFTTQSNDNARAKMYYKACDISVERGEPLPNPGPFLRNNPSISGEGAVAGNKGILNVGVKVQR